VTPNFFIFHGYVLRFGVGPSQLNDVFGLKNAVLRQKIGSLSSGSFTISNSWLGPTPGPPSPLMLIVMWQVFAALQLLSYAASCILIPRPWHANPNSLLDQPRLLR
jgi:hypothetical protein